MIIHSSYARKWEIHLKIKTRKENPSQKNLNSKNKQTNNHQLKYKMTVSYGRIYTIEKIYSKEIL